MRWLEKWPRYREVARSRLPYLRRLQVFEVWVYPLVISLAPYTLRRLNGRVDSAGAVVVFLDM
eukprot:COSAG02_NODE_651_length_18910_cov_12.561639_14_plen_63_part_00